MTTLTIQMLLELSRMQFRKCHQSKKKEKAQTISHISSSIPLLLNKLKSPITKNKMSITNRTKIILKERKRRNIMKMREKVQMKKGKETKILNLLKSN